MRPGATRLHLSRVSARWRSPPLGSLSPAIIRSRLVLPQPEGPIRLRNSPQPISRSIGSSAATPEVKRLLMPRSETIGVIRLVRAHPSLHADQNCQSSAATHSLSPVPARSLVGSRSDVEPTRRGRYAGVPNHATRPKFHARHAYRTVGFAGIDLCYKLFNLCHRRGAQTREI